MSGTFVLSLDKELVWGSIDRTPVEEWRRRHPDARGATRELLALLDELAVPATWAVVGTPNLRFAGTTDGDEPKYIRFCETLYQGLGFEVSNLQPIAQLPPDFRPRWRRNFTLLASVGCVVSSGEPPFGVNSPRGVR